MTASGLFETFYVDVIFPKYITTVRIQMVCQSGPLRFIDEPRDVISPVRFESPGPSAQRTIMLVKILSMKHSNNELKLNHAIIVYVKIPVYIYLDRN